MCASVDDVGNRILVELTDWDLDYTFIPPSDLFELMVHLIFYFLQVAANYLDCKHLLEIGCRTVAELIRGRSPAEIREVLGSDPLPETGTIENTDN